MQKNYNLKELKSAEAICEKNRAAKLLSVLLIFCTVLTVLSSSAYIYIPSYAEYEEAFSCMSFGSADGSMEINDGERLMLYPGGMAFGIKLKTRGVLVSELGEVKTRNGNVCPGADAGIRAGDIIVRVSGREVNTVRELSLAFDNSRGSEMIIEVERGGEFIALCLRPALSYEDNIYRGGLYVRDNTAGIGTVTYIDPETLSFAGLGHGICEGKTGSIMPLGSGEVCDVVISRVIKGRQGRPGELRGCLGTSKTGELVKNCHTGVYGKMNRIPEGIASEPLPVAKKEEVKAGAAYIICTTDSNAVDRYEIEISRVQFEGNDTRNYSIKVTDERLLSKTGGIVQGMSGSPIIQNGRIIGAITHVLLDDPTSGYGIFIGNMLSNTPLK